MADTGLLAHEYEQAAQVARQFTQSVLTVKRRFYNLAGAGTAEPGDISLKQHRLSAILLAVKEGLLSKSHPREATHAQKITVPYQLIRRIERSKRGVLPRFVEDLGTTAKHLEAGSQALTEEDIRLLDDLGLLLDAETSAAFRKLLRR